MKYASQLGTWVAESDLQGEGDSDGLPMVEAIAKLRDEVTVVLMHRHGGNNRSLSFVLAKLDEARHWAIEYGTDIGSRTVINRKRILQQIAAGTDTTVTTENGKDTPTNV